MIKGMNSAKKHLIISCAVIVTGFFMLFAIYSLSAVDTLQKTMAKSVTIADTEYQIENGELFHKRAKVNSLKKLYLSVQAKRVLDFYEIVNESPLLVDDGFDAEATASALNFFNSTQKDFSDYLEIDDIFVPTDYMGSLVQTKVDYDFFKAKPSLESARKLVSSRKESIQIYKDNVTSLRGRVNSYYGDKKIVFNYPGSTTSTDIILSDMALMIRNAEALEKEQSKQESILALGTLFYKSFELPESINPEPPETKDNYNLLDINELEAWEGVAIDTSKLYTAQASCFGSKDEIGAFYLTSQQQIDPTGYVYERELIKDATDNYYTILSDRSKLEKHFLDEGYKWKIAREANSYRCNDLTYYAKLITLKKYVDTKKPILSQVSDEYFVQKLNEKYNKIFAKTSDLEESVFGDNQHSWEELEVLSDYYESLYRIIKNDRELEQYNFLRESLISSSNIIKNKTISLPYVLDSTFSFASLDERFDKSTITNMEGAKHFFYTARNNYSYVFLGFSPATWKLDEEMTYVANEYQGNQVFIRFSELAKEYGDSKNFRDKIVSEGDILDLVY